MMKIAILDDYQDTVKTLDCFSLLDAHDVKILNNTIADPAKLAEKIMDCDALVLIRERTTINDALLSRLPNLKLISQTGKISNHLDLESCTRHRIAVAEGKGSPIAPAEFCWTLIMASSRHLIPYVNNLRQGKWQDSGEPGLGRRLNGRILGIWGYGKIGQRIAHYAKAFEMQVLVWGSEASRKQAVDDGFASAESKAVFFKHSDIVSLHLRLNDTTRHCVTLDDLMTMQSDATLVNTSRAELIEPGALLQALQAGKPGFAAIDVYEHEPVSPDNEALIAMDNVLCTPHLGYVEQNGYELYFRYAFDNINAFANGTPENIANPQVLSQNT